VSFQEIYERNGGWYYHLNCTRKTKGGVDNLFFAEVLIISIRGQHDEFELTCLHMVKPAVDNGTSLHFRHYEFCPYSCLAFSLA
jgi:hypothetical protein